MKKTFLALLLTVAMVVTYANSAIPFFILAEDGETLTVFDDSGYGKYQGTYLNLDFDSVDDLNGGVGKNNRQDGNFYDTVENGVLKMYAQASHDNMTVNRTLRIPVSGVKINIQKAFTVSMRLKMSANTVTGLWWNTGFVTTGSTNTLGMINNSGALCTTEYGASSTTSQLKDGQFHTIDILYTPRETLGKFDITLYIDGAILALSENAKNYVADRLTFSENVDYVEFKLQNYGGTYDHETAPASMELDYFRISDSVPVYGKYKGTYIDYSFDGGTEPGYFMPNGVQTTKANGYVTASMGTASSFNVALATGNNATITLDSTKPISLSYRFKIMAEGVDISDIYFETLSVANRTVGMATSGAPMLTNATSSLGSPNLKDGNFHEIDILYTPIEGSTTGERTAKLYIDGVLKYDSAVSSIDSLNNAVKNMKFNDTLTLINFMLKGTEVANTQFVLDYVRVGDGTEYHADENNDYICDDCGHVIADYSAQITCLPADVEPNDEVTFTVKANCDSFASGEIVLSYDPNLLTFVKTSANAYPTYDDTNEEDGNLILEFSGDTKTEVTVTFKAKALGKAAVKLMSAAFSNAAIAEIDNLVPAALTRDEATVNITTDYTVTFSDEIKEYFTYLPIATYGEAYTFTANNTANYVYTNVAYRMSDSDTSVPLTADENNKYTINNVTGELVITATVTAKSYTVTVDNQAGDGALTSIPAENATYGSDYTLPLDAQADAVGVTPGYYYQAEVKIGETVIATLTSNSPTLAGDKITGPLTITITKVEIPATYVTVIFDDTHGVSGQTTVVVDKNKEYTFTLVPKDGFTYTVTVGEQVISGDNNQYTVSVGDTGITITITPVLITEGVTVTEYLTLDNATMYLVEMVGTLPSGMIYTYDNNNMFVSSKYNDNGDTYVYLVVVKGDSIFNATIAKENLGTATATATEVDYGMDVNMTGKIDANDAQLVYNMYNDNTTYHEFTDKVTVEKFLRADINGNKKVTVEDASAIMSYVLKTAYENAS